MFSFKKLSWKITFIVGAVVILVAGSIAAYMEIRIVDLIGRNERLQLQQQALSVAEECNFAFIDAVYSVSAMGSLAEAIFDIEEFRNDAEGYFDTRIRESMDGFVYSLVDSSEFISAAYFAVHPDLAGYPLVREVYFEDGDDGIEAPEPQSYEEYMQSDSEDMEWFYGTFNTGKPYWSSIYEWTDGTVMVSYSETVFSGNIKIGIAGVDIKISHIENLVANVSVYDTGFALLKDSYDVFFESNEFISGLEMNERDLITRTAQENSGEVFDIRLVGTDYIVAAHYLANGYSIYIFAPSNEVNAEATSSVIIFAILFVVGFILVLVIANIIGKKISRPLRVLSDFMKRAAITGDIMIRSEDTQQFRQFDGIRDETGQAIRDSVAFVEHVINISDDLEIIAQGDLSVDVEMLSDDDIMGKSLGHMVDNLNNMFTEINDSTAQVSSGAKQIADGAQALAQGSTQQSASILELSGSIAAIAEKTKENTETAGETARLSTSIIENAEKGSRQMDEMISAVDEINNASKSIGNIIKTIDEIAFQTNILALNAAVEAARAGQHGKGFAVVAEEVRNLASKSAEAARNTGDLIQNSMEKAEFGARIAEETAASFTEIVSGINESSRLVNSILTSSEQQTAGISQVNIGVDQVAQVVQQNTATAQESAAASEEMSSQSDSLQNLIAQFKLKEDNEKSVKYLN